MPGPFNYWAKRRTNVRAASATSRQPLSIVSAWPQSGICLISVTASLRFLALVGGVGDGPRDRVVPLAGQDHQRSAVGALRVDLRLGPRIEVGGRGLEQRRAGRRHRVGVVELLGLLCDDVPDVAGRRSCC